MPKPIATWNPARGVWETQAVNMLCVHSELYSETWPTSGSMRSGVAYELPTWVPHTAGSECSSPLGRLFATPTAAIHTGGPPQDSKGKRDLRLDLLPTPTTSDTNGSGKHGDGGPDLRTAAMELLPTPTARDHKGAGWGDQPGRPLSETVLERLGPDSLLATPRASDVGTPGRRASEGFSPPLSQMIFELTGDRTPQPSTAGRACLDVELPPPPSPAA